MLIYFTIPLLDNLTDTIFRECTSFPIVSPCKDIKLMPKVANAEASCTAIVEYSYKCLEGYQWGETEELNIATSCTESPDGWEWSAITETCVTQGKGFITFV